MYRKELEKYINEYKGQYLYSNPNILLDIIAYIQKVIEFTFMMEKHSPDSIPKLELGEEHQDTESNKTNAYEGPKLYISLHKRVPVSSNQKNNNQTFADGNLISAYPRYETRTLDEDNEIVSQSLMTFDNHLKMVLVTKTYKEQLKIINILERGLNIYSQLILAPFIFVCGIVSIESEGKKEKDDTLHTTINFHVRSKEVVEIDKSYFIVGYRIFSGQYYTESGELVNGEWVPHKISYDFDYLPPKK